MALDLLSLDVTKAKIQGREFAIENKATGITYLSNKAYTNKMLKEAGWGGVNVIKVLEDYADKYVSELGSLTTSTLYLDDVYQTFIVTSQTAVDWVDAMYEAFEKYGVKVITNKRLEPYYQDDEIIVKSPNGVRFVLYLDLCKEILKVYSIDFDEDSGYIYGILSEGIYNLNEIPELDTLISTVLSALPEMTKNLTQLDLHLSVAEYVDLLCELKFVKKSKKMMCLTDLGETCKFDLPEVEDVLDEYNSSNWLQRHLKFVDSVDFKTAYEIISDNLYSRKLIDFEDFYLKNSDSCVDACVV